MSRPDVDARLLADITSEPGRHALAIARACGLELEDVTPAIARLVETGAIVPEGKGRWCTYRAAGPKPTPKPAPKPAAAEAPQPTGECWCGCGGVTAAGKFFQPGHDRRAESALVKAAGGLPALLLVHGLGPKGGIR